MISEAIILAGGLGTRLRGVVGDRPKPMAPVGGRPFLAHLLDWLAAGGVRHAVLAVGHQHEVIRQHFGSSHGEVALSYVVETEPLGTGGGLRLGATALRGDEAFALNGDTLFAVDLPALAALFADRGAEAVLALKRVPDVGRYGAVRLGPDGRVLAFGEKGGTGPGSINGGVYALRRSLLADPALPDVFSFERDLLEPRHRDLRAYGLESDAYFVDIGIPEDYARAQRELGCAIAGHTDGR
jgi:D-glycero-alpha-D-manno-heptose 1-phosphate guanylyltransferase